MFTFVLLFQLIASEGEVLPEELSGTHIYGEYSSSLMCETDKKGLEHFGVIKARCVKIKLTKIKV